MVPAIAFFILMNRL